MSKTTILVDKQPTEIETQPLTVLCHNTPMRIEVPTHFEINGTNTIECMRLMKQNEWDHIRKGGVFKPLFDIVFQDHPVKLPEKIRDLNEMDDGVKHVAGMVILLFEHAYIKGENIFFRLPEAHLHPAQQVHLTDLFLQVQNLCNGKTSVLTKTKPKKKTKKKQPKGDTLMPSLEMHEKECVEKLGEPFTHVHEWLDELWPTLKLAHRAVRHNDTGVQYVRTKWGDKAAQAARLHIALDEEFDFVDGLWVRKEKGGQDAGQAL